MAKDHTRLVRRKWAFWVAVAASILGGLVVWAVQVFAQGVEWATALKRLFAPYPQGHLESVLTAVALCAMLLCLYVYALLIRERVELAALASVAQRTVEGDSPRECIDTIIADLTGLLGETHVLIMLADSRSKLLLPWFASKEPNFPHACENYRLCYDDTGGLDHVVPSLIVSAFKDEETLYARAEDLDAEADRNLFGLCPSWKPGHMIVVPLSGRLMTPSKTVTQMGLGALVVLKRRKFAEGEIPFIEASSRTIIQELLIGHALGTLGDDVPPPEGPGEGAPLARAPYMG